MLRIGIVAGEASGDILAAELIDALRDRDPDIQVEGIGGPRMQASGCRLIYPSEKLAVMGLFEVAGHYFELVRIRRELKRYFIDNPPDVFIGIDAPDFNLGLEKSLHDQGVRTVHYVSPSVWAWRSGRINTIRKAIDLMLVLFPFEEQFYRDNNIEVVCTGHPLADHYDTAPDRTAIKELLGLPAGHRILAFMPGSRGSELKQHLPLQLAVIRECYRRDPGLYFISSVLNQETASMIGVALDAEGIPNRIFNGHSREVLAAADVALLKSGTVTLECLLCGTPMVVMYRMNGLSYRIIRAMVTVEHASLPNLLAAEPLVDEFLQDECSPAALTNAVLALLEDQNRIDSQRRAFSHIHHSLKKGAGVRAANAIMQLCARK